MNENTARIVRFVATYQMFGDMTGLDWAELILGKAKTDGRIVDFRALDATVGAFGIELITFTVDAEITPELDKDRDAAKEYATDLLTSIIGDSDVDVLWAGAVPPVKTDEQREQDVRSRMLVVFAEALKAPCPNCGTPVGALCDTRSVWVCLERIHAKNEVDTKSLCYDEWSGRYFHSKPSTLELAQAKMQLRILETGGMILNDFYDFVGLEPLPMGECFGWSDGFDLRISGQVDPSGRPCLSVGFRKEPTADRFW